ncbi:MAG: hypothetical protein ABI310_06595, partial [Microbacteriaceae bacterium]
MNYGRARIAYAVALVAVGLTVASATTASGQGVNAPTGPARAGSSSGNCSGNNGGNGGNGDGSRGRNGSQHLDHVFIIMEENHAADNTVGDPNMPFLNSLAA